MLGYAPARCILGEFSVAVSRQAAAGSEPKAAVFAFKQSVGVGVGQAVFSCDGCDGAIADMRQTGARAEDIQAAIPRPYDHSGLVPRKLLFHGERSEFGVAEAVQAAGCSHPEAAFPILIQGEYLAAGQAFRRAERQHFTGRDAHQASCAGPYPEISVMILNSCVHLATDRAGREPRRNAPVWREPIEAIRRSEESR